MIFLTLIWQRVKFSGNGHLLNIDPLRFADPEKTGQVPGK